MIEFNEAVQLILANAHPRSPRSMPLHEAADCILAQDITCPHDTPRFDNSAVDGYGIRLADLAGASEDHPVSLRCTQTIQAGQMPDHAHLKPGTTFKILTGAWVPPGVEAVVMKEETRAGDEHILFSSLATPGENIRRAGAEYRENTTVATEGIRLSPPWIGLIASFGHDQIRVHPKPRVSILITGDELQAPRRPLEGAQIYDANSHALLAALSGLGIHECTVHRCVDDRDQTRSSVRAALETGDVLISVGGVSVGDYDLLKDVFSGIGVRKLFWQIAMKPGKPNYFGLYPAGSEDSRLVFGLPGNPVSALVSFDQLVRPAILQMCGTSPPYRHQNQAILTQALHKKPDRLEFVRGKAEMKDQECFVTPTTGQGSHMLGGLAEANCLILFPKDRDQLSTGAKVLIEYLDWSERPDGKLDMMR